MRRRLAMSARHGWLLRLHCSDCSHIIGSIGELDERMERCIVEAPGTLHPERDVLLDEVCDVEVMSTVLILAGHLHARLADVAPWRGGSTERGLVIADLMSGAIAAGEDGVVLLSSGIRRHGTVTGVQAQRCHIALSDG